MAKTKEVLEWALKITLLQNFHLWGRVMDEIQGNPWLHHVLKFHTILCAILNSAPVICTTTTQNQKHYWKMKLFCWFHLYLPVLRNHKQASCPSPRGTQWILINYMFLIWVCLPTIESSLTKLRHHFGSDPKTFKTSQEYPIDFNGLLEFFEDISKSVRSCHHLCFVFKWYQLWVVHFLYQMDIGVRYAWIVSVQI